MSTYDKVAFNNRPVLYLSAPDITDKSGTGDFPLSNNDLSPTGQPIIFGSEFSFDISNSATVDVTGNPLFFSDTATFECVIVAGRPTEDVSILIDDNAQNALLVTPDGVTLKLFFDNLLSTYSKTTTVNIKDWNKKLYIVVTITSTQATLSVNGSSNIITYQDTIVASDNITIGGGYSGYRYIMDGVGFYAKTIQNKSMLIDDPYSGYSNYATRRHNGRTTKFEGYQQGIKQSFGLDKFTFVKSLNGDQYIFSYLVSQVQQGLDYITVRVNDERVTVLYDIDFDDSGQFTEYLLVGSVDESNIRFIVNAGEVDDDFILTIETIYNGDVLYETPADLELVGQALYSEPAESIVNIPDGVKLPESTYTGTWILDDNFTDTPGTVEIVFKPIDQGVDTYVFASSDGSASYGPTGAITGYTAYLNGQVVTDLDDVRYDQWNHLVLTDVSASASEFYLNSDDGLSSATTISYMLLTGYPSVLDTDSIEMLYKIVSGIDLLEVSETVVITEGTFSGGQVFNAYSYAWAILGAGGS
jgi:hypothetical protein